MYIDCKYPDIRAKILEKMAQRKGLKFGDFSYLDVDKKFTNNFSFFLEVGRANHYFAPQRNGPTKKIPPMIARFSLPSLPLQP